MYDIIYERHSFTTNWKTRIQLGDARYSLFSETTLNTIRSFLVYYFMLINSS